MSRLPVACSVVTLVNDVVDVDRSMVCMDEDKFVLGLFIDVDEMLDILLITGWLRGEIIAAADDDDDDNDNDESVVCSSFTIIVLLLTGN